MLSDTQVTSSAECLLSPQIDSAVRLALIPHLENSIGVVAETPVPMVGLGLSVVPDVHSETPLSTTVLRSSALDTIQDLLIRGERKKAYHYALDEKLWAHALVIASGIDKESWKEAVNEFLKVELASKALNGTAPSMHASSGQSNHGREALRVAYSLFSGQGAAAGMLFPTVATHSPLMYLHSSRTPSSYTVVAEQTNPNTTSIDSTHADTFDSKL